MWGLRDKKIGKKFTQLGCFEPVDFDEIHNLMRNVIYKVMCGTSVSPEVEIILLSEILSCARGFYPMSSVIQTITDKWHYVVFKRTDAGPALPFIFDDVSDIV